MDSKCHLERNRDFLKFLQKDPTNSERIKQVRSRVRILEKKVKEEERWKKRVDQLKAMSREEQDAFPLELINLTPTELERIYELGWGTTLGELAQRTPEEIERLTRSRGSSFINLMKELGRLSEREEVVIVKVRIFS